MPNSITSLEGHLYLSGAWLGVDTKHKYEKDMCLQEIDGLGVQIC